VTLHQFLLYDPKYQYEMQYCYSNFSSIEDVGNAPIEEVLDKKLMQ
jgi:hypothetical protein